MEPYQVELLNMVFVLLFTMIGAATVSAYIFREVENWAFFIGSFVVSIILIFVCFAAAETNNPLLLFPAIMVFGASIGATLGSFTLAVTHGNENAGRVVGVTLGIVTLSTFLAGCIGLFSGYNFQNWGSTLFIILTGVVILSLVGLFMRFGRMMELVIALGVSAFFVVYTIYDVNKIADKYTSATWTAATDVAMGVFLNMVNIFVRLLPIIADAMN